jgi:copper chaperone CopZ
VTCDFCALYIEHRREISERMQSTRETPPIVAIGRRHDYAGGMPGMEKTQFSVPEMWADHHVLRVRQALTALPGVQDVVASSAFRAVALSYDPAVTSPEAIADALAAAGYPIAGADQGPVTQPVPVADGRKDPAWDRLGFRVAHTDPRDARK